MIKYIKGDATAPVGDGIKIIVHICNDVGAWGSGFVMALSAKWEAPEYGYRNMSKYTLGDVEFVPVEDDILVGNMIGQHDVGYLPDTLPPVRYGAVLMALKKVKEYGLGLQSSTGRPVSIHMPLIGCGLAGGNWNIMEATITEAIGDYIPVIVYDFN